jgi:hypothetical protein
MDRMGGSSAWAAGLRSDIPDGLFLRIIDGLWSMIVCAAWNIALDIRR